MMRRDREDPEKGSEYVAKAYPLKVAYCLPILVTQKAYDLCKEPEPKARRFVALGSSFSRLGSPL